VAFLQWALPRLRLRWPGFRKVRRQVHKRIDRRIAELGLAEISDYRAHLESHPREWPVLDAFCRISISRFYRDWGVIDYLGETGLPHLARTVVARGEKEIRVWCAGCASGEEPYTLAILWKMSVLPQFPDIRLRQVATDVDGQMLDRARRAHFQASSLKDVPPDWLDTALTRCGDDYVLRPEFAAEIDFRRQDIRTELPDGSFHLIACRNLVCTYFDEELQRETLRRIVAKAAPDGILVVGRNETPPEEAGQFLHYVRPGVYRISTEPPPRVEPEEFAESTRSNEESSDSLVCMQDNVSVSADDPRCLHPSSYCRMREFCEVIEAVRKRRRSK